MNLVKVQKHRFYILAILIFITHIFYAQELKLDSIILKEDTLAVKKEKRWKITGDNAFSISQNSFSNWIAGGNSSIGINARADYALRYKKGKNIWKSRVILGYGQISSEGEKPKKTDDVIILESAYGRSIDKQWYATAAMTFQTQMMNGYDYGATPDYSPADRRSAFMAPAYLTIGAGLEYKPEGHFQIAFFPITSKTTLVLDEKLQVKGNYGLKNDGDSRLLELGASVNAKYRFKIMDNMEMEHYISLFSNYIQHMERLDVFYSFILDMKVNNYISSRLTLDMRYDHQQIRRAQIKQTLGVGFVYKFQLKE